MSFQITGRTLHKYVEDNSETEIIIPDGIETIGEDAFGNCQNITSVKIPDSVKYIGSFAFYECIRLQNVEISSNVKVIDRFAFAHCIHLTAVTIPKSVEIIRQYAFASCWEIENITIPEGVIDIERGTFFNCKKLKTLHLPKTIHSIGDEAFSNCKQIQTLNIPEKVATIGDGALQSCTGLKFLYVKGCRIPDELLKVKYLSREVQNLITIVDKNNLNVKANRRLKNYFLMNRLKHAHDAEIADYVKRNLTNFLTDVIYFNDSEIIAMAIAKNWISKRRLTKLLEIAISLERIEIYIMLMDYKNQIGGYRSIEEEIQRKFSL